jgi:hypothetical protein
MNAPKRLFNEFEALTETGSNFENSVETLLRPLLKELQENGFSLRDAQTIANNTVSQMVAEMVLIASMAAFRKQRGSTNAKPITASH